MAAGFDERADVCCDCGLKPTTEDEVFCDECKAKHRPVRMGTIRHADTRSPHYPPFVSIVDRMKALEIENASLRAEIAAIDARNRELERQASSHGPLVNG